MNFEHKLSEERAYADQVIRRFGVLKEEGCQRLVLEAMNYSLLAGGKRLRPILMHTVYELFEGAEDTSALERFMTAIELIHTYSLVHDDLPAMDNDLYRRGKKTTHAVYGEAMAILTGDALLNYAFETAALAFDSCHSREELKRTADALIRLSDKAGIYGMVGGQVYDVQAEKQGLSVNEEELSFIFLKKTCALIDAAMTVGAILAGADEKEVAKISAIAENIGMAFQIRDDILDVEGDEKELGKPIGSDAKNNKVTYVTLKGMEQAKKDVRAYSDKALDQISALPGDQRFLYELAKSLIDRRS
ncbi:MAG: polyprenyl synthetase family protein [Lachnospiraceae bacterium]|nr:polyprenyl synthetase family protein [Lachnospiraceae bacterium]